jgi:hypothetical protein
MQVSISFKGSNLHLLNYCADMQLVHETKTDALLLPLDEKLAPNINFLRSTKS